MINKLSFVQDTYIGELTCFVMNLPDNNSKTNISLFNGSAGDILMQYELYKITRDVRLKNKIVESLRYLQISRIESGSLNFSDGYAGVLYMYIYLVNQGFVTTSRCFFDAFDSYFNMFIKEQTKASNYDILLGLIGIGIYYIELSKKYPAKKKYVYMILESIISLSVKHEECLYWPYNLEKQDIFQGEGAFVNMGMLHGMTSIISFLIICINEGFCSNEIYNTLSNSLKTIAISKNENSVSNLYSRALFFSKGELLRDSTHTDLFYCNGDFGVMNTLIRAYEILKDETLFDEFMYSIHYLENRIIKGVSYPSSCVCHGWASLFLFINKFERFISIENAEYFYSLKASVVDVLLKCLKERDMKNGILNGYQGIILSLLSLHKSNPIERILLIS